MLICPSMHKTCKICEQELPLDAFTIDKRNKDGHGARCRPCTYASKPYSPERQRRYKLKHFYGMSIDDYNRMYQEQQGACKICQKNFGQLVVDHDHGTGEVRGLLCSQCNTGIGLLGDNLSTLENAIKYLSLNA